MTAHTTRAHAKRSPSSAYRWMNCPGSVRMSEGIAERKSSIYADEGTAAHILAEQCLTFRRSADAYLGWWINIEGAPHEQLVARDGADEDGRWFEVDDEMVEAVQVFLDTVNGCLAQSADAQLYVEHRVNFSGDEFGTADAIVYSAASAVLNVIDLKYGAGVLVEVKDAAGNPNRQLICYGEGAVKELGVDFEALNVVIVQPRMPHSDGPVRSVGIGPLELLDWSLEIGAAIAETHKPDAPLVAGSWCHWCPAAGVCPAAASRALAVAQTDFEDLDVVQLPEPAKLTPVDVAKILDGLDMLEGWAKAVRAHAYTEAEAGRKVPGYKLVNKIGRRKWQDEKEAARMICGMGLLPNDIHTEPKLKTPAQIEKLVGKKDFASELSDHCPSISSGTTLAPASDRRPEVVRSIEDQFEIIEEDAATSVF